MFLGVICYRSRVLSECQKLLPRLVSHQLRFYHTFSIYRLWYISDNFELYKSLKLSLTSIRGPTPNFAGCEYFLESNFPNILVL